MTAQVLGGEVEGDVAEAVDAVDVGEDPVRLQARGGERGAIELGRVEGLPDVAEGGPGREARGDRSEQIAAVEGR